MSDREMMKIDALEIKVNHINTAIVGDEKLGIAGLVNMLQSHIDQSKKNNEEMRNLFKEFKREIGYEYANSFNAVDLSVNHNKQDFDYVSGRVKVLEENDKKEGNRLGFAAVVSGAIGTAIGLLISAFK
jgi:hypothetical protein